MSLCLGTEKSEKRRSIERRIKVTYALFLFNPSFIGMFHTMQAADLRDGFWLVGILNGLRGGLLVFFY